MKIIPLILLAQSDSSSLAGTSGWFGAGLLGLVLGWLLLKHLPDKDYQISGLIKSKDEAITIKDSQINTLITTFLSEVKDTRNEAADILANERTMRHTERNLAYEHNLKMAVLLSENTQETRSLAQETKELVRSIGQLASKVVTPEKV